MWYVATSATVANGSTVVAINNGDDISNIQEKSALVFEDGSPVEVVRAYLDGGGNKFIQLARPWPYSTKTNTPLIIFPTDADFAAATAELRRVIDTLQVASTVEAQTGTDDEKIMTPLKVKESVEHRAYLKAASDSRFVNKSNIVGTVSQSGGTPTGAIIERGSNSNGEYVKFADGTLTCSKRVDFSGVSLTPNGTAITCNKVMAATFTGTSYYSYDGHMADATGADCYGYFNTSVTGSVLYCNTGNRPTDRHPVWDGIGTQVATKGYYTVTAIGKWF